MTFTATNPLLDSDSSDMPAFNLDVKDLSENPVIKKQLEGKLGRSLKKYKGWLALRDFLKERNDILVLYT